MDLDNLDCHANQVLKVLKHQWTGERGEMNGGTYPGHMKANVAVFVSSQRFLGAGDACLWKALKPEWQCIQEGHLEWKIKQDCPCVAPTVGRGCGIGA